MMFWDFFGFSNSEEQKSVSGQQTHQLVFLSLEAILGTKNQKKRYKGVVTEVTSPKIKETKKKQKVQIKWVASHNHFHLTPFS